jgi:hypothetical protein
LVHKPYEETQFLHDVITSLITEGFSAFQHVTTAASKEENEIVERANKEVNLHLKAFVFDITFSVPVIQRIINTISACQLGQGDTVQLSPARWTSGCLSTSTR